jgi:hypothetical protein
MAANVQDGGRKSIEHNLEILYFDQQHAPNSYFGKLATKMADLLPSFHKIVTEFDN